MSVDRRIHSRRWRVPTLLTMLVTIVIGVSGCGSLPGLTVEQIPLPAPGNIGDGITLTATFANALNLPSRAKVKLNGTNVGEVTDLRAENYRAVVTMKVSKNAKVPVGTGAELRQATPLGDVFVALLPPTPASTTYLADGGTLTGPTSAAATVEDLLVSLAAVTDGGTLGSAQQIITELSAAVSAGPDTPADLSGAISGFTTAITKLNRNAAEVDTALANTRVLTGQLYAGRAQIMASINKLAPAIDAVNSQIGLILTTVDKTNTVTAATNDFLAGNTENVIDLIGHLRTVAEALRAGAPTLGTLSDRLAVLAPKWAHSAQGNSVALSSKLYWLTTGFGFDNASRLPELADVDEGAQSLQQTLTRILAQLTATKGCCG
ncbi:MlaD family protein [Gordonia sp. NPDC003425]